MNAKTIFTAMIPVALGVAVGMLAYSQIEKAIAAKG
jgi:hypothetical protein